MGISDLGIILQPTDCLQTAHFKDNFKICVSKDTIGSFAFWRICFLEDLRASVDLAMFICMYIYMLVWFHYTCI